MEGLLLKQLEEIEELRKKYNFKSWEVLTLQVVRLLEYNPMSFDDLVKTFIRNNEKL